MKINKGLLKKLGLVASLVALGIAVMSSIDTSESPASRASSSISQTQANTYHDEKLEQLREREAELEKVFNGADKVAVSSNAQEHEGDPYEAVGGLSDFDTLNPNDTSVTSASTHTTDIDADSKLDDIVDTGSSGAEKEVTVEESDDVSSPSGEAFRAQTNDEKVSDEDQLNLTETQDKEGEELFPFLKPIIPPLNSEYEDRFKTLNERINTLQKGFAEATSEADIGKVTEELNRLKKRLASLETAATQPTRTRTKHSKGASSALPASKLRNLYTLKAIDGTSAVLMGNNTGKVSRLHAGDGLAYGGTLKLIQNGTVTLAWPQTDVVLSVF